jgi:hypothetical protein
VIDVDAEFRHPIASFCPIDIIAIGAAKRSPQRRDGVTEGLECVLTAVEPCQTLTVGPPRDSRRLEVRAEPRKCLHQYFYLIDRELGWLNVRLQTWFPFTVQVVINGREWLARQLCRRRIPHERRDNCFVDVADLAQAQRLLDLQLRTNWSRRLDRLQQRVHPVHRTLFGPEPLHYYWSADERCCVWRRRSTTPLYADEPALTERQKMSRVTRLIRLLRAHGLVQKVPQTHRYLVTPPGRQAITAVLAARDANVPRLTELAA